MSSNPKTIHATLDHFLKIKFDRIKEYLGIQNDAEVMRVIITETYRQKFDKEIDKDKVSFLYMPLMHSENIDDQNLSVKLFEKAALIDNLRFAKHHRDIIKKYGRFPHRNKILQRKSSRDEIDYLNSDNAFTG